MTKAEQISKMSEEQLIAKMGSKSNVIRYLTYLGYSRSDIAKKLNVRYQMVKNIQDNDLKAKKLDISQIVKDIDAKMSDDKMEDTNQLSLEL